MNDVDFHILWDVDDDSKSKEMTIEILNGTLALNKMIENTSNYYESILRRLNNEKN